MDEGANEGSAAILGSVDERSMSIFSLIAAIGILESRIRRLESRVSELEKGVSDD